MSTLALLPLGSPPEEPLLCELAAGLRAACGLATRRLPACAEPPEAFDAARNQWSAMALLRALLARPAGEGARLLGITQRDLFVPVLTFVFGQAQLGGRVAVISLARLRPEFYGLRPDPALLARRALKEALHEVGHTFGLVHCPDRGCPLALSLGPEDLDLKTAAPCASCAALLQGRTGRHGPPGPTPIGART